MVTTAFSWGWDHHDFELFNFSIFSSASTFVSSLLDRKTRAMKRNVGSCRKPMLLAVTCSGEGGEKTEAKIKIRKEKCGFTTFLPEKIK
jgi:hypothetical protein